jgi:hypothetical protein
VQVEGQDRLSVECPQAAVEVAGLALEEQPPDEAEHGVAEVAVQRGHRARGDAALEPVAHDQVGAVAQVGEEGAQGPEVVGVVAVTHRDVRRAGGADAAHQRVAVALGVDEDDPRSGRGGQLLAAVRAAVVGDDDLSLDAFTGEEVEGLADAGLDGLRLVQTGHDHGKLHVALLPPGVLLAASGARAC